MELNCLSLNAIKNLLKMRNGNITNMFLMKIIIETGNFISTQNIVQIGQPCCTPFFKMENKTIRLVSRHFFVYKTMDPPLWQLPDPNGLRYEYTGT